MRYRNNKNDAVKKIAIFSAVIMIIEIISMPQTRSQDIFIYPLRLNLYRMSTNIAGGIYAMKEIKGKPVSIGLDANGSSYYPSSSPSGVGAIAVFFTTAWSIPRTEKDDGEFNRFFGPVAGAGIGPALIYRSIGGAVKIFAQGNYSFGEKGNFGLFAQTYLNVLVSKSGMGYMLFSPAAAVGCKFKIK